MRLGTFCPENYGHNASLTESNLFVTYGEVKEIEGFLVTVVSPVIGIVFSGKPIDFVDGISS